MREGWKVDKIGNYVELQQGFALNKKSDHHISETPTDYPLLKISDLINNTETLFVKETIPKQFLVYPHELIFSRTGQVGLIFKGKTGVIYNNCFKIIPNQEIDVDYIYYYFKQEHVIETVKTLATGAAQPDLNHGAFKSIEITFPSNKETQKKIASILSGYDDLIENNLKRIKILGDMAQQTYEEWFVRMRFPGHDASRASASVNEETGLPEGWEKVKLGDWIKTSSGGTPSKKKEVEYYENGSIPWVRTGELKNFILIDSEIKITESGLKNSSAKLFPKGTVLLAMYGNTIGETSYCAFETSTNQACCGFLVEKDYLSYFIHQYLLNNKEHILSFRMGAAQENISQSIIQNIELIKPAEDILIDFGNGLSLIYDSIINLLKQNQRLREARDILLPRLMMGMVEV